MIPEGLAEETATEHLLMPGVAGMNRMLELLDAVKVGILIVGAGVGLLIMGAKLERYLLKRQLEVLDGVDLEPEPVRPPPEAARGGRG